MKCKYCKHYAAVKTLKDPSKVDACSKVIVGQCNIDRARTFGNFTFSEDESCGHFERWEPEYKQGSVFTNGKYAFAIATIQPEYYPRCYRIRTPAGGGSSLSAENLAKCTLLWEPEGEKE